MEKIIEEIKTKTNNSTDYIYRKIKLGNNDIYIIYNESLSSSDDINNYILKSFKENIILDNNSIIPSPNLKQIKKEEILGEILSGQTIILIKDNILSVETKRNLYRGIDTPDTEKVIYGPKDSFIENYITNLGLIRRRIKSSDLWVKELKIGTLTKTKVGILYMKDIADISLVNRIEGLLKEIEIDGIIDSGYIKERLNQESNNYFPTIMSCERPDTSSVALLEGKIVIIVDNSPFVLILPTFLIDYFHPTDDYYQKNKNTTFIRVIRVLAFIIAIFLPSYYLAITTHNLSSIPLTLLTTLMQQTTSIEYPMIIEALIMILTFEILRESDLRIPSNAGSAISILGGLVLGTAAVDAGIISPMMIIIIAISAISGLVFQSIEIISAIRYFRIISLILATFLGIYGVFLGIIYLIINLASITNYDFPYLYPFSPLEVEELNDAVLKYDKKGVKKRNPILTKNIVRGKNK